MNFEHDIAVDDNPNPHNSSYGHDDQHLAEDIGKDTRLVGEELVGAEILFTKEFVENIGILWKGAERLSEIGTEQIQLVFDDYATTCNEFTNAPELHNYSDLLTNHCLRRLEHLGQGVRCIAELATEEVSRLENALFGLWKPFFAVINRDWRSRE